MSSEPRGDTARIVRLLEQLGYEPERMQSGRIRMNSGGIFATIMLYADGSLGLRCRVVADEDILIDLERVNRANQDLRFGTFSIDHESKEALLLESDFVLDPAAADAEDSLRRIMGIWDGALGKLKSLVLALQPA